MSVEHLPRGAGGVSVQQLERLHRQVTYRLVVSYGGSFDVADISRCVIDSAAVLVPSAEDPSELASAVESLARSRLRRSRNPGTGHLA
jgi:hypothetical protein